jgi:hypothetical protein
LARLSRLRRPDTPAAHGDKPGTVSVISALAPNAVSTVPVDATVQMQAQCAFSPVEEGDAMKQSKLRENGFE